MTITIVKNFLFCCLKMEEVGVYVTTIHDKNTDSFNSFSLVFDPIPLYMCSFTFMINKHFPEFGLSKE